MMSDSPFSQRNYRYLFSSHILALFATGVLTIALGLKALAIDPAHATAVMGTALAIKMMVYVIVAPWASQLAAGFSPRTWLIGLDICRAAILFWLPWVDSALEIYLAIALISAAAAAFTPIYQTILPSVCTSEQQYLRALAWAQSASALEQVTSPLLIAGALYVVTVAELFTGAAVALVIAAGLLTQLGTLPGLQKPSSSPAITGLTIYCKTPRLRAVGVLYMAVAAASAMVIVNTAAYAALHLQLDEQDLTLAFASVGLGTLIGASLVPKIIELISPRTTLLMGGSLLGLVLLFGTTLPDWPELLMCWAVIGMGLALCQTPVGALITQSSSVQDRAAVFGTNFSLSHACWFVCYLLAGWLVLWTGWSATFLILGLIAATALVLAAWMYPRPDPLALTHTHATTTHSHTGIHDALHAPTPHGLAHQHLAHQHGAVTHSHPFVIDSHHPHWPQSTDPRT